MTQKIYILFCLLCLFTAKLFFATLISALKFNPYEPLKSVGETYLGIIPLLCLHY